MTATITIAITLSILLRFDFNGWLWEDWNFLYGLSILLRFDFNRRSFPMKFINFILSILLRFDFNLKAGGAVSALVTSFNPIKVRF